MFFHFLSNRNCLAAYHWNCILSDFSEKDALFSFHWLAESNWKGDCSASKFQGSLVGHDYHYSCSTSEILNYHRIRRWVSVTGRWVDAMGRLHGYAKAIQCNTPCKTRVGQLFYNIKSIHTCKFDSKHSK